jgi:hypothetical protein
VLPPLHLRNAELLNLLLQGAQLRRCMLDFLLQQRNHNREM